MSKIISYILKTLLDSKGFLGIVLRSIISLLLGIATYTLYNEGYSLLSVLMLVCSICFTESLLWVFYGKQLGNTITSKKLIYTFPIICFLVYGVYITAPWFSLLDAKILHDYGYNVHSLYFFITLPTVFILLTMYVLSWDTHIERYNPKLRILHMLLLISMIAYFLTFLFIVPNTLQDYFQFRGGDERLAEYIIVLELALIVWLYLLKNNQYYFVYPQKIYILYLRSFATSLTNDVVNACKSTFKCDILEVADPTTGLFGSQSNVDSLYLPNEDWKPQVRYYIKRAAFVLCEVGTSEGVKWEMFNNEEFIEKYIFWIKPDIKYVDSESDSIVKECLTFLADKSDNKDLFFCIKKNVCMYSTSIEHISQVVMTGNTEDDIQEIKLARSVIPQYKGNDVEAKDILRLLQRFFYLVLSKIWKMIMLIFKFISAYIFRPINLFVIQPLDKYILQPIKKYA